MSVKHYRKFVKSFRIGFFFSSLLFGLRFVFLACFSVLGISLCFTISFRFSLFSIHQLLLYHKAFCNRSKIVNIRQARSITENTSTSFTTNYYFILLFRCFLTLGRLYKISRSVSGAFSPAKCLKRNKLFFSLRKFLVFVHSQTYFGYALPKLFLEHGSGW